jgi:hypothetical protein
MKKQFLAFLMLTAMFWGCNLRKDVNYTAINPETLEQAKLYFQNNQNALIPSKASSRTEAEVFSSPEFHTFTPLWDKTVQTNLTNGNKVLITPVSRAMYVQYPNNLYFIRRLRTELNRNGRPIKAHIVELVTTEAQVAEQKDQIITNFFTEIETRTNARLIAFDIGYNFEIGNTKWQSFSGITESTHCYNYDYVMICNVMFVFQAEVPCPNDPTGGNGNEPARSAGQRVESCGSGGVSGGYTGGGNQDPPGGGGGGNPSDIGQDQPFIPDFVDYNGVNIQLNYRNAQGELVSADTNVIKAFKFVIDNSTFRTIIKDYLPPNEAKLKITFDINTRGGKFDATTNIISFNPNLLNQGFNVIDLVQILVHEGIHAMFAKPSTTITTQITTARNNLVAHYSSLPNTDPLYNATPTENMVQHEAMGENYLNDAVSILRAFYNSGIGKTQNNTNITDDAYKAFFLGNLVQVETPLANQTGIINMFITKLSNLTPEDAQTYSAQFILLRNSYK